MRAVVQVFGFDLLSKVLVGGVGIAVIRLMEPGEYARLTFALAITTFASQALVFSFNRLYVVGEGGATQDRIDGMVSAQLIAVTLVGIVLLFAIGALGALYVPVIMLLLTSALTDFTKTIYQRDQRFFQFSMVEIGRSVLYTLAVLLVYLAFQGTLQARWVLTAQVVSMLSVILLAWRIDRRPFPRLKVSAGAEVLREMVTGAGRFLLLYFVMLSFSGQIEVFLLQRMASPVVLAGYGAAVRYYGLLSLALGALHTVLLPMVHEARKTGRLDQVLYEQRRLGLVVAPVLLLAAVLAGGVLPLLDGGRYPESVSVFRILTISALFSFLLSPYTNILISAGRYRTLCARVAVAIVAGTTVSLLAIPRLQAIGAAFGQTTGFLVLNVLVFLDARALPSSSVTAKP